MPGLCPAEHLAQTRANTESLERQYELAGRAVALGWDRERVRVVDADLGLSGADAAGREGFQQLVAEVAAGPGRAGHGPGGEQAGPQQL